MKRKLLLLITVLQAGVIVSAQVHHWSLQATAGVQFNYFTDEQPHRAISSGLNAQARINYALKKGFGLFAEAGYAGNGGNLVTFKDDTGLGFDPTITFKNTKESVYVIHSIESSLGLTYYIPLRTNWKLRAYAAPQLAINMGEWEKYEKTGSLIAVKATDPPVIGTISGQQFTDKFQPYWFSVYGGLQLELPLKKSSVLLDLRFVNGITPVRFDYSYLETPGIQGNIRTNSFRLGLGYQLPLHHRVIGEKAKIKVKTS